MRQLLLLLFLFTAVRSQAQYGSSCKDSLNQPNTYFPCGKQFAPVCGCDNITYRNSCAAQYWGGLNFGAWGVDYSVCTNLFIDMYPTAIDYYPATFNILLKTPGVATLFIYDAYGKLWYQQLFNITNSAQPWQTDIQLPVQNLPMGIYNLIVTANGEMRNIKFGKVTVLPH